MKRYLLLSQATVDARNLHFFLQQQMLGVSLVLNS